MSNSTVDIKLLFRSNFNNKPERVQWLREQQPSYEKDSNNLNPLYYDLVKEQYHSACLEVFDQNGKLLKIGD